MELVAGTLGGLAFGAAGGYLLLQSCLAEAEGLEALACIFSGLLGYAIGLPIGSTIGVNAAGALLGVRGNLILSFLGAIGGELLGTGVFVLAVSLSGDLPETLGLIIVFGVVPLLSSAGATLGFNAGARLAEPMETSMELEVPISAPQLAP